ncbi:MAG: tetratricopeptide repeat protein [Thermoplasmata archaeon]
MAVKNRSTGNDSKPKLSLIDREEELNELLHYQDEVLAGTGKYVLLGGEVGVGKTYLAEEFIHRCEEKGFQVLKSKCLYHESTEPYLPFYDALEDYLREEEEEYVEENFGPGFVQPKSSPSPDTTPVGWMGGANVEEEDPSEISFSDQQEVMFNEVSDLLIELSENNPLIFFMDDLQWIDRSSAQLMHHLSRKIMDNRILFLGAYRTDELKYMEEELPMRETLNRMKEEDIVNIIRISRLDQPSVSDLVRGFVDNEDIPDDFIWTIYRETEGNPFYIVEILDSMVKEGIIDLDSFVWDSARGLSDISLPSSLKDIASRKLERLGRDEKKVLYFAALIGDEFDFELLEKVIDIDVITLLDIIDELREQGIIEEVEDSERELYRFDHLQTRKALREEMGRSRERVSHKLLGEAIESLYDDEIDDHLYGLAHHFYEGREFKKAYEYSQSAGEKALQSLDISLAIDHFEKSLDSLEKSKEFGSEEEEKMKSLQIQRIGELHYDMSEWEAAKEAFEQFLDIAEKLDNDVRKGRALRRLGHVYREMEVYDEAREYFERSLEIIDKLEDISQGIAECHRGLGYICWRSGELDESREHHEIAIENAQKEGNNKELALNYIDLGNVFAVEGDHKKAMQYYDKALPILESKGIYGQLSRVHNNIGDQFLKTGDYDEAIDHFEEGIDYADKIGNDQYLAWAAFNKSEALARKGELERSEKVLKKEEKKMKDLGERLGEASVKRVKGMISRKEGEMDKAIEYLEEAKQIMDDFGAPFPKAEDMVELGITYRDAGDKEKARETLEEAKKNFKDVGAASKYIEKVEEILESLDGIE